MGKHAFIIGGTGQVGQATAHRLVRDGWQVTISSRHDSALSNDLLSKGVKSVRLDRDQPGSLQAALKQGTDAVIDVIAYHDGHAKQLLEIQQDVGTFIIISSSGVYVDEQGRSLDEAAQKGFPNFPAPIKETQPTVNPGPETYSTKKIALERRMLDHSRPPITILRPGAIYGSHSTHPREWWFVKRMLDGRKIIPLAFEGQSRFHTCAATNIAELIISVLERPYSRILNIADPHALTTYEIGMVIAKYLDWDGRFSLLNCEDLVANEDIGRSPWSVPMPFVLNTKSAESLGYSATIDYEKAAAESCDWLCKQNDQDWEKNFPVLAAYPYNLFEYTKEDMFFDAKR